MNKPYSFWFKFILSMKTRHLIGFFTVLLCFIFIVATATIIFYKVNFPGPISPSNGDWGAFRDFFGGTLNPILSFVSFIALLITIVISNKELEATRHELRLSRKAQCQQAEALSQSKNTLDIQIEMARLKEKRDLTMQTLERWTSPHMREKRMRAWNFLNDLYPNAKSSEEFRIPLPELTNNSKDAWIALSDIFQFMSDLNKLISQDLLDDELTYLLFHNSIYPWFTYIDRLDLSHLQDDPSQYSSNVKDWYQNYVISLKSFFDDGRQVLSK